MKRILKLMLVLLLFVTLIGCNKLSPQKRFDEYMDFLFLQFVGTDPNNVNSTLLYPQNYNITTTEVKAYTFDEKNDKEYYAYLKAVKNYILSFNDKYLSSNQRLTKRVVVDYLNRQLAFEGLFYYGTYLGSYLGYQAQLPISLAEYRFDDIKDIEDYFSYLKITDENFKAIVAFEKEKIKLNMGLTDPVLNKIIIQ